MSNYANGLSAGMAARNAAIRESDQAINQWKLYSNNLKLQLVRAEAERKAGIAYTRALRKAIADINPNHPLLKEGVAVQIIEEGRKTGFAEQGYSYDPKTGNINKRA